MQQQNYKASSRGPLKDRKFAGIDLNHAHVGLISFGELNRLQFHTFSFACGWTIHHLVEFRLRDCGERHRCKLRLDWLCRLVHDPR